MKRKLKVLVTTAVLSAAMGMTALAGQWKQSGRGWWYDRRNFTYPANQWSFISGSWYFFNGAGYMETGWIGSGGDWFFCSGSGAMVTGWNLIGSDWYYFDDSGYMVSEEWIDDYYLLDSGRMAKSQKIDGILLGSDGRAQPEAGLGVPAQSNSAAPSTSQAGNTAQQQGVEAAKKVAEGFDNSGEFTRYCLSDGSFAKNQFVDLGRDKKYWFQADTSMARNTWVSVNGTWYHAAADGHMDLGFQVISGMKYYFNDPGGDMKTNAWQSYGSNWYYFDENGQAYRNITKTIDGKEYRFDADGKAEEIVKAGSKITISGQTAPQSIKQGNFFGLYGEISSVYPLSWVKGAVWNASGGEVMGKTLYPNSTSCSIYPQIDDALIFNNLTVGSYRYVVTAQDNQGLHATLIDQGFTVTGSSSTPPPQSASSYSPDAAITYAANNVGSTGEQCAGFVSKCLQAGGAGISYQAGVGGLYRELQAKGYGISQLATRKSGQYQVVKLSDNSGLQKGDVTISYCAQCNLYTHSTILSGQTSNDFIKIYATNVRKNNQQLYVDPHCGKDQVVYGIKVR